MTYRKAEDGSVIKVLQEYVDDGMEWCEIEWVYRKERDDDSMVYRELKMGDRWHEDKDWVDSFTVIPEEDVPLVVLGNI